MSKLAGHLLAACFLVGLLLAIGGCAGLQLAGLAVNALGTAAAAVEAEEPPGTPSP